MAQKRMIFLQRLMAFSGINPERLRLRWVSSAEAGEYADAISEFVEDIKKIGPNPLKTKEAA
jgi:F420-non-reducing hydrogenase iron-sulfur subunit